MFLTAIAALVDAVVYRFRGGGFFSTGHDWIVRLVWGAALTGTDLLNAISWYAATIIPTAYLSMLVPHAFCQNMGRWPTPQKAWPAFFQATLTDAEWTALPMRQRTVYDMTSMGAVALIRAAIVFAPLLAFDPLKIFNVLLAIAILTIGQPVAYFVGWLVPFSIGSSLTKQSTTWGEFFNGAVWALALAVL